jgi:hypothetical protein
VLEFWCLWLFYLWTLSTTSYSEYDQMWGVCSVHLLLCILVAIQRLLVWFSRNFILEKFTKRWLIHFNFHSDRAVLMTTLCEDLWRGEYLLEWKAFWTGVVEENEVHILCPKFFHMSVQFSQQFYKANIMHTFPNLYTELNVGLADIHVFPSEKCVDCIYIKFFSFL